MKIKRESKFGGAHVETSPMNDIMFFLMLFFLIVSTLANPSVVKLVLPNSKKMQEMDKQLLKTIHRMVESSRDMYEDWARSNPQMDEGYNHFMENFEPTLRKLREL